MDKELDIEVKYQRLATEYSKVSLEVIEQCMLKMLYFVDQIPGDSSKKGCVR